MKVLEAPEFRRNRHRPLLRAFLTVLAEEPFASVSADVVCELRLWKDEHGDALQSEDEIVYYELHDGPARSYGRARFARGYDSRAVGTVRGQLAESLATVQRQRARMLIATPEQWRVWAEALQLATEPRFATEAAKVLEVIEQLLRAPEPPPDHAERCPFPGACPECGTLPPSRKLGLLVVSRGDNGSPHTEPPQQLELSSVHATAERDE